MTTPAPPDRRRRHSGRRTASFAAIVLAVAAGLPAGVTFAASPGARVLKGSVPPVVLTGKAVRLATAAPSSKIDIAVSLRLRDRPGLDKLLASASDPSSLEYGHYLTQAEANARFNPTAAQEARVTGWLRANGLVVTHTYANHLLVDAQGTAAQMNNLFKVTLNRYSARANGKQVTFYANAVNPTIDASVGDAVQTVLGLDDYPKFHTSGNGSAANGPPYYPQNFADAYDVNPLWDNSYTGAGQSIGITLWEPPPSDLALAQFQSDTGANVATRANGRLSVISVGGGPAPSNDNLEGSLDVEYSSGMAPGASINYYAAAGPTDAALADALNAAGTATDAFGNPLNRQITNSWGGSEDASSIATIDPILASNAATGHNYFFASGDNGSWSDSPTCSGSDPYPDYPASSAYVTSVGGTRFDASIAGAWPGEVAWLYDPGGTMNSCSPTPTPAPEGSGGGYSRLSGRPSWQTGIGLAVNGWRGYPDVAADADLATGAYVVADPIQAWRVGGTSLASPLWAGMTAVLNQYLSANGRPTAGFIDPMLYAIANRGQLAPAYHDITQGKNGTYNATPGWDAVTGWGSPDLYNLARDWTGAPYANTGAATNIGQTAATLTGTVGSNGTSTTYHFDYGTTTGYGATTPTASAGTGGGTLAVSAAVAGLTPGTTYHYRTSTTNSVGIADGLDQTFATASIPSRSTIAMIPGGSLSARRLSRLSIVHNVRRYVADTNSVFGDVIATTTTGQGEPLTTCVGTGRIHLYSSAKEIANSAVCGNATGSTELFVKGFRTQPLLNVHAVTDPGANYDGTQVVSPAASNVIALYLRPTISFKSSRSRARRYPLKGRVSASGNKHKLGKVVIQRKSGHKWKTVASLRTNRKGVFKTTLALTGRRTSFRARFVTTKSAQRAGWLSGREHGFSVKRR